MNFQINLSKYESTQLSIAYAQYLQLYSSLFAILDALLPFVFLNHFVGDLTI